MCIRDSTSPTAVKVLLDPSDIPLEVNVTNKQVRVLVPEGTIIKGMLPEEVKVTRMNPTPTLPVETESVESKDAESEE